MLSISLSCTEWHIFVVLSLWFANIIGYSLEPKSCSNVALSTTSLVLVVTTNYFSKLERHTTGAVANATFNVMKLFSLAFPRARQPYPKPGLLGTSPLAKIPQ